MSNLERTISILFEGEDNTAKAFKSVAGNLDTLESGITGIAKPFAALADGIIAVDSALVGLSGAGLAYAYKKSIDYENALVGLNKVLDENTESLSGASDQALKFSDKYGQSFTDIIGQTTDFRQAGYDLEESLGLVNNALELLTAGDVEAAQSADILKRTLKGLGEDADYAREIVAALNLVSNNFAANVPQLGEALARSAPLAGQFGLSMQETLGILTPMIEVFQDAEQAATAFKSGLARLKDDTGEVEEAFRKLGFSQEYIANRSLLTTKEILFDVAGRFNELDSNMQSVVSSALFGKEHFAKLSVVMQNMGKVAEISTMDMAQAYEALDKEIATRLSSSEQQIDRFINNMNNLAAAVGDRFKAAATESIGALADLEESIRKSVQAGDFDPVFEVLTDTLDYLGTFIKQIAELVPEAMAQVNFDELVGELEGISGMIGDFFDSLDLTTAEGLAAGIQAAVDTITGLIRVTVGMAQQFKPVFDVIGEGVRQLQEMDRETAIAFGNFLGAAKLIVEAGAWIAGSLLLIGESGAKIENVFNAVIGSVRFLWNGLQVLFDSLSIIIVENIEKILKWASIAANIPGIPQEWRDSIAKSRQELDLFRQAIDQHQTEQIGEMMAGGAQAMRGFTGETRKAREEVGDVQQAVKDTTEEIKLIPPSKFSAVVDKTSYEDAKKTVREAIPKETTQTVKAKAEIDTKQMQAEFHLLETKTKATADIIQSKIEWDAKLEIAEFEANAQKIEAIVAGLSDAYAESTDLIGAMFGDLKDLDASANDTQIKWRIFEQMERENELREKNLAIIAKLAEAEIKMMEAQRERFESGDALLTFEVDGSRLEYALEYVLDEMLKYTHIKAGEEDVTALLGLTR